MIDDYALCFLLYYYYYYYDDRLGVIDSESCRVPVTHNLTRVMRIPFMTHNDNPFMTCKVIVANHS